MSVVQAIVLAVVQGLTELFPISSLGHAVILPDFLGWHVDELASSFLPFLVVLHLGTAAALLVFFWRDWVELLGSAVSRQVTPERAQQRQLLLLIVIATVPAGIVGLLLQDPLRRLFGTPWIAALFLIVNGLILFAGERLRRRRKDGVPRHAGQLTVIQALWIGLWQSTALVPGISRSGVTMVAGLLAGLREEDAARFSFLLATPIIGAAGLLEVPKLLHAHAGQSLGLVAAAGVVAGVTAFLSLALLMRYFHHREVDALNPFAAYCVGAGALSLLVVTLIR